MKLSLKRLGNLAIRIIPSLALIMAISSVSSTCFYCLYQPDVPTELSRYKAN